MRKKERFVLGKRTFRSQKSKHFVLRIINPAVLMRIGQRIKETRIRQHITQEELATASGVSPLTVANIEKGKSVSLLLFISVLRSLGLLENLEQLVPEIRVSPIELKKLQGKKRYRVRHLKQDNHE